MEDTTVVTEKKTKRKMPKILKVVLIILGVLVGLFLLMALLISPIAKSYIEKHSPELIGRQVTMDDLSINLFKTSVEIDGFRITEQDMKTDFVTFDTLKVAMNPFKLLSNEIHLKYITLVGPDVKIVNQGDRFNFSDLLELGDTTETEVDTTPSNWAIGLYNIELRNGSVTYADNAMGSSWTLKDLEVAIPGLYFGGQETDAGISFELASGGSLTTQAKYDADKNTYGLDLKLNNIALANAEPFVKDIFGGISSIGGTLSGNVNVDGSLDVVTDVDVRGKISVNNVALTMNSGDNLASLRKLEVGINRINPEDNVFDFSSIELSGLNTHFDMYANGKTNFDALAASNGEKKSEEPAAEKKEEPAEDTAKAEQKPAKPMVLKVASIDINDVNFTFNDNTMAQKFSYPIKDIRVKTENFVLGDPEKFIMLRAQLPNAGSLMLRWKGGLSLAENQNLYVSIKNLTLKNFSPYVMHYLAYPVTGGVLSFVSENTLRSYQLNSKNKIDIYNITVEKKDKSVKPEYNIPLRAALYILKDKDDKIQFDVPVSGNINSPEFSYTKLIFKTLGNLLVKVALSPVSFVSKSLGLSPDELEQVEITPMQHDFTSEQYEKFSKIADAVKTDPDMRLTLVQQIDYQSAMKEFPMFELKKEYYLTQNPEKRNQPRLSTIDNDNIMNIKDKDKDFKAFAEDLLKSEYGSSDFEQNLNAKFPPATVEQTIQNVMEMRNTFVRKFLVEKMEVPAEQVVVKSLDFATMKAEKCKNQYKVEMKVDGATEEVK